MAQEQLILGIDLGTTNSLAAVMKPSGPEVIRDGDGKALVPSVICIAPDSRVIVGAEARSHAVENPTNTVYSVKRLMGRDIGDLREEMDFLPYRIVPGPRGTAAVQVGDKAVSPEELSAIILGQVKSMAQAALGREREGEQEQEITQAVITVPAYFDDSQRQATRAAGRIAGLDVRRIVNEPTAAALAYGLQHADDAVIAVYDFGGGTFDISILRVCDGVFQVLSTDGDPRLRGVTAPARSRALRAGAPSRRRSRAPRRYFRAALSTPGTGTRGSRIYQGLPRGVEQRVAELRCDFLRLGRPR